jgi:uroporphyrinogen-III decarboxylase
MRFSPGIYEHAAALIGRSPWEVSRNGQLLAEAHRVAWECYRHPLVVAGIDVYNLEPEAYGAVIERPKGNNIPAISRHPCSEISDLLELPPLRPEAHARINAVLQAGELLRDACPGATVLVPVCGPFALAIGLLGLDELLMGLVEDRNTLFRALTHLLDGQINYLSAIHVAGLQPVFFESGTTPPLLPVQHFREVEAPLLRLLLGQATHLFGAPPHCIIGGDAAPVAGELLEAGPGFVIAPSETNQQAFMQAAMAHPQVHVRVNMSAAALLERDFGRVQAEADRALAVARLRDNTSVGCGVVPFEADPELVCRLTRHIQNQDYSPLPLKH